MLLSGMPLKVKVAGIAVLALLLFSLVGTALEAFSQYRLVQNGAADAQTSQYQLTVRADAGGDPDGNAAVRAFKFVCPFH